jgi:putative membrane protein insertion efficiency factor
MSRQDRVLRTRRVLRTASRAPAWAVIGLLRVWQLLASPTYGATCRFYPSCSEYAAQALKLHGLVRGSWLAVRRLSRCHPWNPGGVDHVPPATHASAPEGVARTPSAGTESGYRAA